MQVLFGSDGLVDVAEPGDKIAEMLAVEAGVARLGDDSHVAVAGGRGGPARKPASGPARYSPNFSQSVWLTS
jgi:hypothetical protein